MTSKSTVLGDYTTGSGNNLAFNSDLDSANGTDDRFDRTELENMFVAEGYSRAEAKLLAALFLRYDKDGNGLSLQEFAEAFAAIAAKGGTETTATLTIADIKAAYLNRDLQSLPPSLTRDEFIEIMVSFGLATAEEAGKLFTILGSTALSAVLSQVPRDRNQVTDADVKTAVADLLKLTDVALRDGSVYSGIVIHTVRIETLMKLAQDRAAASQDNLSAMMTINAELNNLANILNMLMQQFNIRKDAGTQVSKSQ